VASHQHTPLLERRATPPAGRGGVLAGTLARKLDATALFTGVLGRGILRNPFARCGIVAVIWCQKRPIAPVLRIEAGTASWGVARTHIVVTKVGAFISVSSDTATLFLLLA
jgi:hypothetical protein